MLQRIVRFLRQRFGTDATQTVKDAYDCASPPPTRFEYTTQSGTLSHEQEQEVKHRLAGKLRSDETLLDLFNQVACYELNDDIFVDEHTPLSLFESITYRPETGFVVPEINTRFDVNHL